MRTVKLVEVAKTPAQQLIEVMRAMKAMKTDVSLELDKKGPTTVILLAIWSEGQKRVGAASNVMSKLVAEADKLGVKIELNVHFLRDENDDQFDDGPRNDDLERWYKKYGFVRTSRTADLDIHSGEVDMEREPK